MLDVDIQNNLIFDLEGTVRLRDASSRVCARLIGSYSNTASKSQASISSIPSQISSEELGLLVEKRSGDSLALYAPARLVEQPVETQFTSEFDSYRRRFELEQTRAYRETRKKQLVSMRSQILNGKRKKLQQQLSRLSESGDDTARRSQIMNELDNLETEFESELQRVDRVELTESAANTEIFVRTPEFYYGCVLETRRRVSTEEFWSKCDAVARTSCRYRALRSLWERGYYLTNGLKFGGDYLVYPGDPASYHAQFILVCLETTTTPGLTLAQLITYARMATSVKKTFLIAFVAADSKELKFLSINWSHI